MVDYHVIMDLLPIVSSLYFEKRLGEEVKLGAVQSSILLALGLQRKTIEQVEVSGWCLFENAVNGFAGGIESSRQPGARAVRQVNTEDQQAVGGHPKVCPRSRTPIGTHRGRDWRPEDCHSRGSSREDEAR